MMRLTRLLSFSLALLIAVTSQQMAVARGMTTDVAGQVILCTGQGPVVVTLDTDGNPVEPVHICPDCALTLMAFADTPVAAPTADIHMQTLGQTALKALQTPSVHIAAHARGPPLFA